MISMSFEFHHASSPVLGGGISRIVAGYCMALQTCGACEPSPSSVLLRADPVHRDPYIGVAGETGARRPEGL